MSGDGNTNYEYTGPITILHNTEDVYQELVQIRKLLRQILRESRLP